jgi:putative transposase
MWRDSTDLSTGWPRRGSRVYRRGMPRVPRTSLPDGYFHVFARGIASDEPLFRTSADRDAFVELLGRVAPRYGWTCHALCVMGSHYHLVVETTRVSLSSGLQQLNWRYARHVNQTYDRLATPSPIATQHV